jgi:anti-sigma factor RsiW
MKNCHDIENLLPLYSEGILSEAEKRAVDEHLADCSQCRKELAYLQKSGRLADDLTDVEEPPWFQQKIMAQVRAEAGKKSFAQKWFYPLRIKIPVQIMATIVIAILAVYIYRSGDEQVKQILPGIAKPAQEIQKEQAPAPLPQAGDLAVPAVPRKKIAVREEVAKDKQEAGNMAAGGSVQKSEAPESKLDKAYEVNAYRGKGLAESKDGAYGEFQAGQNEAKSAKTLMADQAKEKVDRSVPALARKKESYKMAAPAAPQSVAASVAALPQTRVFVRVDDLNAAASDVEQVLARYDAKQVTKQLAEGKVVIRAEVAGKYWQEVITKLKGIGQVEEKGLPADIGERVIHVMIEISGR